MKIRRVLSASLIVLSLTSYIDAKDTKIKESQIISAIKKGVPATQKLLKKLSIDYISKKDDTLLHYAVRFRKRNVVEYLVRQKIVLSEKGGILYGTALQEAIYYGYLGIASYLIDMGTPLDIKDNNGQTALHLAVENGYLDIATQLVNAGASKRIHDANGKLPYDLIPKLSWDSRKEFQNLLRVSDTKNSSKKNHSKSFNDIHFNFMNSKVKIRGNENINVIDKKSKVDAQSNMGLDVDIQKVSKF